MNIKWSVFNDNSSERDTLYEFAQQGRSIQYFKDNIFTCEAIKEIRKIRKIGVHSARRRAKQWLHKNGFSY
ncbi:MAG TPA: hypothetical protein VMX17_06825 [Candidatus Glassbacteria bacterium]|nr:hypothetical protein [Candidatus Glassbacteria bacterium]